MIDRLRSCPMLNEFFLLRIARVLESKTKMLKDDCIWYNLCIEALIAILLGLAGLKDLKSLMLPGFVFDNSLKLLVNILENTCAGCTFSTNEKRFISLINNHLKPPLITFTMFGWWGDDPFFSFISSNFLRLSSTLIFIVLEIPSPFLSSSLYCSNSLFWSSSSLILSFWMRRRMSFSSIFFLRKMLSTLYLCWTTMRS